MADWHVGELEQLLTKRGWRVAETLPGDDYRIAATWAIERGDRRMLLDFECLPEGVPLSLEHAHACSLRGLPGVGLSFGKRASAAHPGRTWSSDLEDFVAALDAA
jgi:hypothetical protein